MEAFLVVPERSPEYGVGHRNYRVFLDAHGVADERRVYDAMNLPRMLGKRALTVPYTGQTWLYDPKASHPVVLVTALGVAGYVAGPDAHVIDTFGLVDPLLARMPLVDTQSWRIGHFRHSIPDGYLDSLNSGTNEITDPNIRLYYDRLSLVVRGPLWDSDRLVQIWNLNSGRYDFLLARAAPPASP